MLALIATALAVPPLLDLDGDTDPVRVTVHLELAESPEKVSLEELARGPVRVEGAADLVWCAGEPISLATVTEQVERAENHIAYMEHDTAGELLERITVEFACIAAPTDPALIARVFFLQGLLHHRAGLESEAVTSFQRALTAEPELTWDEAFPPRARGLFDRTVATWKEMPPAHVSVVPNGTIRLQGREHSTGEVAPGTYVIEVAGASGTVEFVAGTSVRIIVPTFLQEFGTVDGPAFRDALSAVLPTAPLLVVQAGRVWSLEGGEWADRGVLLPESALSEVVEPLEGSSRFRKVTWVGSGLALGGAAAGTVGLYSARRQAILALEQTSWESYQAGLEATRRRTIFSAAAYTLAAAGGALAVTGLLIGDDGGLRLLPVPGGLLLQGSW